MKFAFCCIITFAIRKDLVSDDYTTTYDRLYGITEKVHKSFSRLHENIQDALGDLIFELGFYPSYANDCDMILESFPKRFEDTYYLMRYLGFYEDDFGPLEDPFYQFFLEKKGEFSSLDTVRPDIEPFPLLDDRLLLLECGTDISEIDD